MPRTKAKTVKEFAQILVKDWTPERRTRGVLARGKSGNEVRLSGPYAVQWCVLGEIEKFRVDPEFQDEIFRELRLELNNSAIHVNDSRGPEFVWEALKRIAEKK